jgi:rod shape determining protein RodA
MTGQYSARDFDWTLIGLSMAIATLGLIEIFSATRNTAWSGAHYRQVVWIVLGLLLMWMVSSVDYNWWVEHVPAFYIGALVLLGLVAVFGHTAGGARRWLMLPGGVSLQISEFVKFVLVLVTAYIFGELPSERITAAKLWRVGGLFGLMILLVVLQPDLSTALSYVPILAIGFFMAGIRWKYLLILALAGLLAAPLAWYALKPYQKDRLMAYVDPESDPQKTGYQSIQSQIAVGSGEIWGRGFARGTQTQLRFLPTPHTDFIFSAFAEEAGFVGVLLALTLYFAVLMRIVGNAQTAVDNAGMYICMGVAAVLLFHLVVNVSMIIGRMPVTGIPLPLMSYGGSNTIATFMLLGLVNNVRLRRFTN